MPTVELSSARVAYQEQGEGPTVLLLHATLHDSRDYAAVADDLAQDYRVVALDWPGHGQSPVPAPPCKPGAAYFAEVLAEFVEALNLTNMVVAGNSVGGYAACRLALALPERVAGLVLIQGSGFTPRGPVATTFCTTLGHPLVVRQAFKVLVPRYMGAKGDQDRELTAAVVARSKTPAGAKLAAHLWRSFNDPQHDLRRVARGITQPTLVMWGTRDRTQKAAFGRAAHDAMPGSQYVEMDTGHVPFVSDPAGWLEIARPFIQQALTGRVAL